MAWACHWFALVSSMTHPHPVPCHSSPCSTGTNRATHAHPPRPNMLTPATHSSCSAGDVNPPLAPRQPRSPYVVVPHECHRCVGVGVVSVGVSMQRGLSHVAQVHLPGPPTHTLSYGRGVCVPRACCGHCFTTPNVDREHTPSVRQGLSPAQVLLTHPGWAWRIGSMSLARFMMSTDADGSGSVFHSPRSSVPPTSTHVLPGMPCHGQPPNPLWTTAPRQRRYKATVNVEAEQGANHGDIGRPVLRIGGWEYSSLAGSSRQKCTLPCFSSLASSRTRHSGICGSS